MPTNSLLSKMKEKYKEGILTLLGILMSTAYATIPNSTWEKLSAYIPTKSLWAAIGVLLISALALASYIFDLRKKLSNDMKLQFGMYWNNNKQPHCIKCKTPLIQPAKVQFEDLFKIKGVTPVPKQYCITCDKYFSIVDVNRSELTLEEAQAKVKTV